ncbi:tetratricopeptide repeat protein [Pelagicoccus sp. NFK12]|uniref:Tetratricopeptide repeat protein n=1 Tax=Pelagicoccus enzymogenes TaxID=2773457 RepID=A0A927F7Y8_9BACT|nr:tetratricopeptide repeat protein [Pelagicoccus enzymogenes]MBD5779396.1 tetratricopeptide repeat protein [Pelagicoccus enzymogenes]
MRFSLFVSLFLSLPFSLLQSQETAPHFEPLPFYEAIKDRLTPLSEVKEGIDYFKNSGKPGIVLLNERIEYVAEDKERYRVDHSIYYVLEQSGVDPIGKDTFRFRKEQESIHLVLAHAIQKDGKITPVAQNAVFVQSPQEEADSNLYTDYDELVVIFPDIDVGSITEHIVITKEFEPIVENQLVNSFYFQFNWPIYLTRYELDVPDSFAERFQRAQVGTSVPAPSITSANGRTRLRYEDRKREGRDWEMRREPSPDTGPVERVTTFSSWDEVGNWIRTLVNERNTLSDELKSEIDSWTQGLTERNAIIQAILDPIANEVRYTGLEFGLAGYQPYDCNEVWKQKYGDCKDKANLLAAALQYKGIDANIVLIDTDSLGKFDRSFPSPFHFNHAITVVHGADGAPLFLDATVENLKVGDLPGNDANRDVLIIMPDRTEIGRTPLVSSGQVHFAFELNLSSDLSLSGWLHMYVDGYYGSWYETEFKEKSEEGLRWNMHERIDGCFPGAEMADVTFNPNYDANTPIASSYFTLKNETSADANNYTFALPDLTWFLPSAGDSSEGRSTEFSIDKSESTVSISIKLPGSIRPQVLPKDLNISTPDYQYTGQWWQEENRLNAKVSIVHKTDRITPKNFSQFHKSIGSVNRWWKTPATFATIEAFQAAENQVQDPFPKLSSAVAQLALVDDIYSAKEPEKRRKALEQVIVWFPDERSELYEAKMELVRLDIDKVAPQQLAKRIEYLVNEYKEDITHEYHSWGEYLLAQELEKFGKEKEALKIFIRHAEDETLSAYRRGWSSYNAAWILQDSKSKDLIRILKLGMLKESGALNDLAHLLVVHHLDANDQRNLQADLNEIEKSHPQKFQEIVEYVSDEIEDNHDIKDAKSLKTWRSVIEPICDRYPELSDCLAAADRMESTLLLESKLVDSGKRIQQLLKKLKPAWYSKHQPSRNTSQSELDQMIRATEEAEAWEKQAALCLAYYTRHPEQIELASKYFYWAIWNLNNHVRSPQLESALFEILLDLPPANSHLVNANINFAKSLRSDGDYEKAVQILQHLVSFPSLEQGSRSIAHIRYAEALEEMGRAEEAIAEYLKGGKMHFSNYRVYEGLLRCFFLAQINGDATAATQALQYLAEGDSQKIEDSGVLQQVRNVLAMNQDTAFRDEYWRRGRELIAAVYQTMDNLGIELKNLPDHLPLIRDYDAFTQSVVDANQQSDLDAYHSNLIVAALSAATNQADLKLALSLISQNLQNDVVTLQLFSALADLAQFAAYEGSYLQADELKRLTVHAYLANEDLKQLREWSMRVFRDGKSSPETIDFAILMLAGHVASKGVTEDECFTLLKQRLDSSEVPNLRPQAVNLIAALQTEAGEFREAKQFITRELQNPLVAANESIVKSLNSFLDTISRQGAAQAAIGKVVTDFIESAQLTWWEHIHPLDTESLYSDGIPLHKLDDRFDDYSYVEMVKHYFLLAQSDREDSESRQEAIIEGARFWQYIHPDPQFVFEKVSELAAHPDLDPVVRNDIKIAQLYYLINLRHTGLLEKLLSDDTFLADSYREDFKHVLAFMKMPTTDLEESLAAIRFLIDGPFSDADKEQLRGAITNVVTRFGPEAITPILEELPKLTLMDGVDFDLTRLRLDALQAKRSAQKLHPIFQLLSGAAELPSKPIGSGYFASSDAIKIENLPSSLAYQVQQFGYSSDYFSHLSELLFYLNSLSGKRDNQLLAKIYQEILKLDPSIIASAIAYAIGTGIDQDNVEQRDPFLRTLRDYATQKADSSFADIHNQQLLHFSPTTQESSFLETEGASRKYQTTFDIIRAARSGNRSKALATLQTLDTEVLIDPELTFTFYSLARELGDSDLALLLAEQVEETIRKQIAWSISNLTWMPINYLPVIVSFPEQADSLLWYFDLVAEQSENELILAHNDTARALARSDWQGVLDAVERADAIVPTFWDLDLAQGIANFELGRFKPARDAFETYLHYRPNSPVSATAKRYLDKIDTKIAAASNRESQQPIR